MQNPAPNSLLILPSFRSPGRLGQIGRSLGLVLATLIGLGILGWIGGRIMRQIRISALTQELQELPPSKRRPATFIQKLKRIRELAPHDPRIRQMLAISHMRAAMVSDPSSGHREAALREMRNARSLAEQERSGTRLEEAEDPIEVKGILLNEAMLFDEFGLHAQAKANLEHLLVQEQTGQLVVQQQKKNLPFNAQLYNNLAYLLARSPDDTVRDPARAMALITRCIKLTPEASRTPSFLDTLAVCHHAKGNRAQALQVQRRILTMVDEEELFTYIDHYQRFLQSAPPKESAHADGDR
ncbi:MAG: hypothetical protein ACYTGH_10940 [Planctomycetota bacterium]|jgi:tetratricopeptide (TPR) repeat protein